jgi:endonuclease YncB( thermonuclease family)
MRRHLLFAGLAFAVLTAHAENLIGKVAAVADGDTVTVLDNANVAHKIRLAGIDAPEKKMPYGLECRQALVDEVLTKPVTVEWTKHDRYQRLVGKVMVDGLDANLEQLKRGCAWHYKQYASEQSPLDRAVYANAEIIARQAGKGLWADPAPVPPWEWRHRWQGE